jgi:hypothetical protein
MGKARVDVFFSIVPLAYDAFALQKRKSKMHV